MHLTWSTNLGSGGEAVLSSGERFVVARRMELPDDRLLATARGDDSLLLLVRLPYVSNPALVLTATDDQPALYRGQRANGAVVEVRASSESTSPAAGQHMSLPHEHTEISLRFPDLVITVEVARTKTVPADGSGTVQLGLDALDHDDAWLVGALAVALSPANGVVAHADLKSAFAKWRDTHEPSVGAFDRNVLRPALESRAIDLPGPRVNKIVYLVERCRATGEFPERILDDVRARLE